MNKPLSLLYLVSLSIGVLARVCLAPAKTRFEAPWQCRNQGKAIGADLNVTRGPFYR